MIGEEQEDRVFSPLSIEVVLAMAYQGAGGETAKKFASILNVAGQKLAADDYKRVIEALNIITSVTLDIANKIFIMKDFPLKNLFKAVIQESFLSETDVVDFGQNVKTAEDINQWVERKTHNKIKDLISANSLNKFTRLVLVNAVYFKGTWAQPFNESDTSTEPFFMSADETVDCEMMFVSGEFNHWYSSKFDAAVIELPYEGNDVSMIIILPEDYDGIAALEKAMANVDLSKLKEGEDIHYREVEVSMPKFKIETTTNVKPLLEKMGLGVIFDPYNADFSEVSQNDDQLFVSEIVQKAIIEVNEQGTVAAAATECMMMLMSGPTRFTADHPFMFVLQTSDKNGSTVLFVGKVIKPTF